jgi:hypothetical protein
LAKPGRAVFSSESVAPSEYEELVRSADVGLALYGVRPGSVYGNDNVYHMGLSSGKLSQYLQAGVPVVVTDLPSLRRLTTTYRCGEVVTDPEVTEPAIRRILADYESYARNAVECFSRELELTRPFAGLLNALDRLA